MPGTRDKDQISSLLYHRNIIPLLQIVTKAPRGLSGLFQVSEEETRSGSHPPCDSVPVLGSGTASQRVLLPPPVHTTPVVPGNAEAYPDWPEPLRPHRCLSWSPSPWAGPVCISLGLKAGQQHSCLMERGHVGCPYDCVWGACMQDGTGVRREQGQGTSIFILAPTLQIFSNPNQIFVSV